MVIVLLIGVAVIGPSDFFLPEQSTQIEASPADEAAEVLKRGTFVGTAGHDVAGTVLLLRDDEGLYLRFENYSQTQGPDVSVYGSSPYRILLVALLVISVSALLYPLTGGIQETQADQTITYTIENPTEAPPWWLGRVFFKSLYFSVVTFSLSAGMHACWPALRLSSAHSYRHCWCSYSPES